MEKTINSDPINIALASDHRYLRGLLVTLVGIARSASEKERLRFHILSDGLTDDDKRQVSVFAQEYGVQSPQFHAPDMAPIRERFKAYKNSHAAFLRLFLPEMLDCEWVVYSDVDTLWLRDISELWSMRDNSVSLMWCRDLPSIAHGVHAYSKWNPDFDESKYACSGVVLMNLARLRETGFTERAAEFVEKWGTPFFVDQDILNYVCRDDAIILPQYWDCMMPTREAQRGLVYHFNGIGSMFNGEFVGWRPIYYAWFRFYYDFILKQPRKQVCGIAKRVVFWLLGSAYPSRTLLKGLLGKHLFLLDNIYRQLFFAWLWRHAEWRWNRGR